MDVKDLIITTGDGLTYYPKWQDKNQTYQLDLNTSVSSYINKEGSFVSKGEALSPVINLTIFFTGEEAHNLADDFVVSAKDKRNWKVSHPKFGKFDYQCLKLNIDKSGHFISTIEIEGIKIITSVDQSFKASKRETIESKKEELKLINQNSFENDFPVKTIYSVNQLKKSNELLANAAKVYAKASDGLAAILEAKAIADQKINSIVSTVSGVMSSIQSLIDAPFNFANNLKQKLTMLKDQYNSLKGQLSSSSTKEEKKNFEATSSYLLSSYIAATVNEGEEDYQTLEDLNVIKSSVISSVNDFVNDLESFSDGDYFPNAFLLDSLIDLANTTASSLQEIVFEGKLQIEQETEKKDNLINLTHYFYGFSDENLEKFIKTNSIGYNEIFCIKKGRNVKYIS